MTFGEPLEYSLITTIVNCDCGRVMKTVRLHGTFLTDKGRQGRPLGKSELLMEETSLKTYEIIQGTPACDECLDKVTRIPRPRPTNEPLHSAPRKATKPTAINIDDLDL